MMGQVFWEARGIYAAKIDLKTPPRLIYREIVPLQSEYEHGVIIWSFPSLNGFNGSVFLSELFGCHCFTNVCVSCFFSDHLIFKVILATDSPLLLCLEPPPAHAWICFYNRKMEFFRCLHDPAGWVQGKWSYHGKLILNKLSVCLFCFALFLSLLKSF